MVRRHLIALTVSGTSVIGTLGATVSTIAAPAMPGEGRPIASSGPPVTVYDDRYIDDLVVVSSTVPIAPPAVAESELPHDPPEADLTSGRSVAAPPVATVTTSVAPAATPSTEPARQSDREAEAPPVSTTPTTAPSTTAPRTAPTVPMTTTTMVPALPPGAEVPKDWPAGTPYPPIPPGCRKPHLEDDGRWNCEH